MKAMNRLLLAVLLSACAAFAQFDAGQISGFIRDTSGANVPGAIVVATNQGSLEQRKTVSNQEGYYTVPQLFVGRYDVSVEAAGFKKYTRTGIVIDAQSKVAIDIELTVP